MKYRRCLPGLALLAGFCLLAVGVSPKASRGDDRKVTRAEQEARARAETNAGVVLQLSLAHDLAEQGRRTKSPLALVTAAQLLRTLKSLPETVKDKPKVEGDAGAKAPEDEILLSPREESDLLLKDARSLAEKQVKDGALTEKEAAAIETLARQVEKSAATRGARGGPQQRTGFVHPGQTHVYTIDFNGLTPEYVRVFGNGKALLRVQVRNRRGVLSGEETAYNPGGTWYSGPGGGVYSIHITNVGEAGTSYRMITN